MICAWFPEKRIALTGHFLTHLKQDLQLDFFNVKQLAISISLYVNEWKNVVPKELAEILNGNAHVNLVVNLHGNSYAIALSNAEDGELIEAMRQSMIDMINSGTTHFIDYREGGIDGVKLLRKASADLPIKPIILGRDDSFYGDDPDLSKVKVAIRKLLKIADGIADQFLQLVFHFFLHIFQGIFQHGLQIIHHFVIHG